MFIKKCCIENCKSSASRSEDVGVTFHKFPKNTKLRKSWVVVTHHKHCIDIPAYVCSRHFCKNDFQVYQDYKYVLKTDAVPSIFSWTISNMADTEKKITDEMDINNPNTSSSSKESEENVEVIRKFMEQQDREIEAQKKRDKNNEIQDVIAAKSDIIHLDQPMEVTTSVLDMLLSESETKVDTQKEMKPLSKHVSKLDGGSVALSVGSKVEARDYGEIWYPAEILEVDCDEMEVLVHYDSIANKSDEWISVSSSRLRPIGTAPKPSLPPVQSTPVSHAPEKIAIKEEMPEEKDKRPSYVAGERCLARWRDNRRFVATVTRVLDDGSYEIMFDDGFTWKCTNSRLYKLKDAGKVPDSLSVDTSVHPSISAPSPILPGVGPSSGTNAPFHTHLFDPTRDYLGSKTERREMKRKLNIKEIFNIGRKKSRNSVSPPEKPVRVVKERKQKRAYRRKIKQEPEENVMKTKIPEAVASIIGTVGQNDSIDNKSGIEAKIQDNAKENDQQESKIKTEADYAPEQDSSDFSDTQTTENNVSMETASEEEVKLVKFDKPDEGKHEEVIDKIKEAINKLEGGIEEINKIKEINKIDSPKPEIKNEVDKEATIIQEIVKDEMSKDLAVAEETAKQEVIKQEIKDFLFCDNDKVVTGETVKEECLLKDVKVEEDVKPKKKLSKIKKSKKLRLLQEKKVKKQVEKVKNELQDMKRQIEEMRLQMLQKTEELAAKNQEMPESFLLPGEWCCKWVNGQPVGMVSELETEPQSDGNNKPGLPRRSVQVEDKRLPEGWTKHMVRRSLGQSAGKWDVVLVGPDNKRFHTKTDMRNFMVTQGESLRQYERALFDFGVHLKLARRMGWCKWTSEEAPPPTAVVSSLSPLVKRKNFIKKRERKEKKRRLKVSSMSLPPESDEASERPPSNATESANMFIDNAPLEDGYVFVGSLKVQVIDSLLRCPAEGCFKSFRNNTLIKMHIKYYHRDLRKMLGSTPKVLDLAYARTKPTAKEVKKRRKANMAKILKVKLPKLKTAEEVKQQRDLPVKVPTEATMKPKPPRLIPRSQDSPKLRQVLANKPIKRPKVLLPVRRPEPEPEETIVEFDDVKIAIPDIPFALDFETAIATHTVTKPDDMKTEKKSIKLDEDEWFGNSDFDTRSSCPGSATPDSKSADKPSEPTDQPVAYEHVEEKESNKYIYTESGERVKIEHMKREEIINCHCGYREEDGLMVQCELCLCWQHALCHNIQREAEVPEKYTCSICLNPKRGRRSKRFLHDQDRLYEGLLPGAKPCESLRRSHELSGNLLRIQDALHALRVKDHVAATKNHPKLYLWAKDWENAEITMTQEKLNSGYSDLNIIINNIGKENLPVKPDDMKDLHLTLPDDEHRDSLMNMSGLSSPGGTSLDLPISTADLERLAKTVQEQETSRAAIMGPQPEAAIDNAVCRERLLRHLQRCQALIDARLDSIEAQVAELESQDPSFEDDETADYFPRTKQTIQMLMRDLDTMEELGIIT